METSLSLRTLGLYINVFIASSAFKVHCGGSPPAFGLKKERVRSSKSVSCAPRQDDRRRGSLPVQSFGRAPILGKRNEKCHKSERDWRRRLPLPQHALRGPLFRRCRPHTTVPPWCLRCRSDTDTAVHDGNKTRAWTRLRASGRTGACLGGPANGGPPHLPPTTAPTTPFMVVGHHMSSDRLPCNEPDSPYR